MSGKLTNRTRKALTFNLTTTVAPVRKVFDRMIEDREGSRKTVQRRVVFPDSITVLVGTPTESLADGVQHCPEVAEAIKRRDVIWTKDPVVEATPEPASTPAPAPTEVEAVQEASSVDGDPTTSRRRTRA